MNDRSSSSDTLAATITLLRRARLNGAVDLARLGRYDEAAQLMRDASPGDGAETAITLDLLARIAAQQGKSAEAQRFWTQVTQLDPRHEGARRGLERLARINRRRSRSMSLIFASGLAVAGLVIVCGWLLVRSTTGLMDVPHGGIAAAAVPLRPVVRSADPTPPSEPSWAGETKSAIIAVAEGQQEQTRRLQQLTATVASGIATNQQEIIRRIQPVETDMAKLMASQQATERELQELHSELAHRAASPPLPELPSARPTVVQSAPHLKLDVSGVSMRTEGSETLIVFNDGLFDGGTELREKATDTLRAFALALKPQAAKLNIAVIGYAAPDELLPGRAFRDHVALSLRRATVVAEVLREYAQCPPTRLSVQGVGHQNTPYLSGTKDGHKRGQTVVLVISDK